DIDQALSNTEEIVERGDVNATSPVANLGEQQLPAGVGGLLSNQEIDYLTGSRDPVENGRLKQSPGYKTIQEVTRRGIVQNAKEYRNSYKELVSKFVDPEVYQEVLVDIIDKGLA